MPELPDIPANALVACPKTRFEFVRIASYCLGCQYFQGLVQGGETGAFGHDHRVTCAFPMTRTIKTFRED